MACIYSSSDSSDGRFPGRASRGNVLRRGNDSRRGGFLPNALLRILRGQTGRRKNRSALAQIGYDEKRDESRSALHGGYCSPFLIPGSRLLFTSFFPLCSS